MSKFLPMVLVAAGVAAGALSATPTFAQVVYAPSTSPFNPFRAPADESYDTHPSYQIGTTFDGRPAVAVVHRCAYIGGWNAGDFVREENGTPLGYGHTCPDDQPRSRIRAAY